MNTQRITDLSYLKEIAGGETTIMKEFIELFLEQIPEFRTELRSHLQNRRWDELGKTAHKAKSSVMTFGLTDLGIHLKQLQVKTQKPTDVDSFPADVEEFDKIITAAELELREDLKNLQ